ncbi:MAG: hypothetical protein PHV30_10820 [Candidatus Margulisbacteria bacterium]|nr:hypothetical protein [Candidatus Margulisiibacteriota bacterium]
MNNKLISSVDHELELVLKEFGNPLGKFPSEFVLASFLRRRMDSAEKYVLLISDAIFRAFTIHGKNMCDSSIKEFFIKFERGIALGLTVKDRSHILPFDVTKGITMDRLYIDRELHPSFSAIMDAVYEQLRSGYIGLSLEIRQDWMYRLQYSKFARGQVMDDDFTVIFIDQKVTNDLRRFRK